MKSRERQRFFNSFARIMAIFPLILSIVMIFEGTINMVNQLIEAQQKDRGSISSKGTASRCLFPGQNAKLIIWPVKNPSTPV